MSMATLEDIFPCPLAGELITHCHKADVCDGRHVVTRGGQHRMAQPLLVCFAHLAWAALRPTCAR